MAVVVASAGHYGWALLATNTQTAQVQQRLAEEFDDDPTLASVEAIPPDEISPPLPGPSGPRSNREDAGDPAAEASADEDAAAVGHDEGEQDARAPPNVGEPVAKLSFARPGGGALLTDEPFVVVEGIDDDQLALGPGRYPTSAMPGDPGLVAIAGHRVTYGAPFYELDVLEPGHEIRLETEYGSFLYVVTDQAVVEPQDTWVLDAEHGDLVLTTCHPRLSGRQRLVVWGREVVS